MIPKEIANQLKIPYIKEDKIKIFLIDNVN